MTDMAANATNIPSMPNKNSGLVAKMTQHFSVLTISNGYFHVIKVKKLIHPFALLY